MMKLSFFHFDPVINENVSIVRDSYCFDVTGFSYFIVNNYSIYVLVVELIKKEKVNYLLCDIKQQQE